MSIYRGSRNWGAEAERLRTAGISLPHSGPQARAGAAYTADTVSAHVENRKLMRAMQNRSNLAGYRTGSNMQIAIPKMRQPLGTMADKGIPFNVEDDEELKQIRTWCRLFYATHDLVPLLIDIYSKFPVVGLEFDSKDPLIKKFYEDMFLGPDLDYMNFLPNSFAREYFTVGEVTALAHFDEMLGVWSSEEILNPDMLRVSRGLFVQRDRVQLMVKEMVENLRQGPQAQGNLLSTQQETPSEKLQRTREYQELVKNYPEIIQAAAQDDGLDISDALISRVVNRNSPWSKRGSPHLLRSFRTLMQEESLNAAQDAVADRLYSPLILATLGSPDLGDGTPWLPSPDELDDARDDFQTALSADFRLVVHNFGLKVENVFGRESVPNLDPDYERIQTKLMQAWGIGAALITGGDGGAYASSALNREFVTQMMVGFQNEMRKHINKRAEVIAEAQGHFDYDLKGGVRVPIYREIVETDPETGEKYIRKVPKLLIPDVKFSTLNLRDESQERAFIAQLKAMGVPVSDKTMSVNIDMEFEQELERQSDESVNKLMATAQTMRKVQVLCDQQDLPYPPELAQHLMATLQLRQGKNQTELSDAQTEVGVEQAELQGDQIEMQKAMLEQQMAGGQMPPGAGMMPPAGAPPGGAPPPGGDPAAEGGAPPPPAGPGGPPGGDSLVDGPGGSAPASPGPGAPGPGSPSAGFFASKATPVFVHHAGTINGPMASPPKVDGPVGPLGPELPPGVPEPTEPQRNRMRPAESDDNRPSGNLTAGKRKRTRRGIPDITPETDRKLSRFETGPSSFGARFKLTEAQAEQEVQRRQAAGSPARHPKVSDLINDPSFFRSLNKDTYRGQLQADWPEILAGGAPDSKKILDDMLQQYYELYGVEPEW
jgi:hypothetical protein